jgi:mono/diheme cytochrome c family protein
MRGVSLLAALAAGASFACGGAADTAGSVDTASSVATGTSDAAAPLDCPPTRVISDVSEEVPKATASGAAVNMMAVWCVNCHAPDAAEPAPSGPAVATDFNRMIDEGFVIDCDAERSPIIISMRANEMPPPDFFGVSPSPGDIDQVAIFIELDCRDEETACAESPSAPGCDEVLAARRARRCAW